MTTATVELESVLTLSPAQRVLPLAHLGRELLGRLDADPSANGALPGLIAAMVALIEDGVGSARDRVELGEVLGLLGDPRVATPDQARYWVTIPMEDEQVQVGRFHVTNAEFRAFVDAGGYQNAELWEVDGWEWLTARKDPWPVISKNPQFAPLFVPNQPVVAVTWYEAMAYAKFHGARLPRFDERLWATRGAEKRPYPWGAPFGDGNANTREEVLGRPVAVGLYVKDQTPEGVRDLAGNVAEWCLDAVGPERVVHPGGWDSPSMAAWAKARVMHDRGERLPGLGFRLARD